MFIRKTIQVCNSITNFFLDYVDSDEDEESLCKLIKFQVFVS